MIKLLKRIKLLFQKIENIKEKVKYLKKSQLNNVSLHNNFKFKRIKRTL